MGKRMEPKETTLSTGEADQRDIARTLAHGRDSSSVSVELRSVPSIGSVAQRALIRACEDVEILRVEMLNRAIDKRLIHHGFLSEPCTKS
jgi:anti-anti-sigma regulatory factor